MSTAAEATAAENKAALAKATANLNAVMAAAKMGTAKAMEEIGIAVTAAVKMEVSHPGHGRVYYVRFSKAGHRYWADKPPGTPHQASAPGEPPAVDTGKYRASWAWVTGKDPLGPFVEVGTNAVQGPALEFGSGHMAARPHLRPVIAAQAMSIREMLVARIVAAEEQAISTMKETHL